MRWICGFLAAMLSAAWAPQAAPWEKAVEVLRLGTVRIRTPLGTDFMLRIGKRPFQTPGRDGKGGALRVAPVEDSGFGQIRLAEVRLGAVTARDVVFEVDNGRITRVRAAGGASALSDALASAGGSAGRFAELSLGFDPEAASGSEAAGTVCLGFGGNQALGGASPGPLHSRYCFADATMHVDFRYLVRDGKLAP
jgi:leucyl aminopeptidase (aminopeptidase T)